MMLKCLQRARVYLLAALACLVGLCTGGTLVRAADGSSSYNYSYWGNPVPSPAAYQATALWNGEDMGVGAFKNPSDLFVTAARQIYVLDSGNNRIVVADRQGKLLRMIDSFTRDGKRQTFNNPQGIFVTDNGHVFIADTGNKRVVHLDPNGRLVSVIDAPKSELLPDNFTFQPVKIAVDKAFRIYVMSAGVYDGFMEFSADGTFTSFIGANRVTFNPVDYFWKMISTRAQRSQMVKFTPTEFTNLDIDNDGFLYATNAQPHDNVKKLNAQGNDILRRQGYFPPEGDIRFRVNDSPTRLVDIDVGDSDMYSILDSSRGRIFTYNGDGYLLYVFGGIGNQFGQFKTPVAMERLGDDFLVLDKALGEITLFQSTAYGRTLNEAVRSYYRGDEEKAYQLFQKTIDMNANLEFAYSGIGKALLRQGDYAEAMKYFKRSKDQQNYSKAFLLYRKQELRKRFPAIMTCLLAAVVAIFVWRKVRKRKGGKNVVSVEP